jgi:hypothetical protein
MPHTITKARSGLAVSLFSEPRLDRVQGASASHRAPAFSLCEGSEPIAENHRRGRDGAVGDRLCRGSHFHDGTGL